MGKEYRHHIFMGSHTAKRWIEMIFYGKIALPEYQRTFSWRLEKEGKLFYDTLQEGGYIPPVTLGRYNGIDYLVDGQQRLTTLLCLEYKIWPRLDKIKVISSTEEDEEDEKEYFTEFDFKVIQKNIREENLSPDDCIIKLLKEKRFDYIKDLDMKGIITEQELNDLSLKNMHIPYNYITWGENTNPDDQAKFYSKTFKTINNTGKDLTNKAIRLSEYWYHKDLADKVYNKEFEDNISVNNVPLDFIEYLALSLSNQNYAFKGRRYARDNKDKLEFYIIDFIEYLTQSDKHLGIWAREMKGRITPDNYRLFREEFDKLKIDEKFASVIYADYYLLGLIYHVYNGSKIDDSQIDKLKSELKNKIQQTRDDKATSHVRQPNAKKYIQERLDTSRKIWEKYMEVRQDNV